MTLSFKGKQKKCNIYPVPRCQAPENLLQMSDLIFFSHNLLRYVSFWSLVLDLNKLKLSKAVLLVQSLIFDKWNC